MLCSVARLTDKSHQQIQIKRFDRGGQTLVQRQRLGPEVQSVREKLSEKAKVFPLLIYLNGGVEECGSPGG